MEPSESVTATPVTVVFESCSGSIKVKTKLYGPVSHDRLEAERIIGKHRATQLNNTKSDWHKSKETYEVPFHQ